MLLVQSREVKGLSCVGHLAFTGARENYTELQQYLKFHYTWFSKTRLLLYFLNSNACDYFMLIPEVWCLQE